MVFRPWLRELRVVDEENRPPTPALLSTENAPASPPISRGRKKSETSRRAFGYSLRPRFRAEPCPLEDSRRHPTPMLNDLRFAFRMIATHRWFSAAVVATFALGIGIGINTTVFTLVNAVLFKPVPIPGGEEEPHPLATAATIRRTRARRMRGS